MTNQDPTQVGLPGSPAPQLIDTNADGIADQYAIDADGNGMVERWNIDANQDGVVDEVAVDLDANGMADRWDVDLNQDGITEGVARDVNADGRIDQYSYEFGPNGTPKFTNFDTDGDGNINQVGVDLNGDGAVEAWTIDNNQDGTNDVVAFDTDGDGEADQADNLIAPELNTNLGNIDLSTGNVDPTLYNDSGLFDLVENTFHNPIVDSTSGDWRYEENDGDGVANGVDNFPDDITRY